MLGEIARLMAMRMSYQDPIRVAQLKLAELEVGGAPSHDVRRFRFDELIGALPAVVAEPVLDTFEWLGWEVRRRVPIRFSTRSRFGIRRLKIEAGLRGWGLFSVRYGQERGWGERWGDMIRRSPTQTPKGPSPIAHTA